MKRGGILFFFDDFHFCRSRVIGLDMMENRIFTLCRMITWVLFLRMFWNFISSLPVKRGRSLSFLVGTIRNVLVMEIGWTDVESGGYILVSCAHSNTSWINLGCYVPLVVPFQHHVRQPHFSFRVAIFTKNRHSFLAHLAKGKVSFCHHLTSVVRRLSSVHFSHFNLLLWNPSVKWSETW